jgi:hypothetical protein
MEVLAVFPLLVHCPVQVRTGDDATVQDSLVGRVPFGGWASPICAWRTQGGGVFVVCQADHFT